MNLGEKEQIDTMSHKRMCEMWRFSACSEPLLQGETGQYFKKVLFEKWGGFTPEISKKIGWE